MKKSNWAGMALLILGMLTGCGGGGSSTPAASTPSLSGVAAVGYPIVGGTINVRCASGSAPAPVTTGSTGAWQIGISGQTLPCAVQVSGGTINGAANTTPYHSITTAAGTVNVTPLTDMMVANLAGIATPDTWFTGLGTTPAPLTAISQTNVDTALTNLRSALPALTPLGTINPITTTFTAASGNASDDMLTALHTAMTNTPGVTYATLLSNASVPAFTAPTGFGTALATAYAGMASGGGSAIPAAPAGVTATASSASQINVNWTNVSGATAYNIYRSTSPNVQIVAGNKITPAIAQPTAGPFPDTGLSAATAYYYKVTAVNADGESTGSSEVSATTPAAAVVATPTVTGFSPNSGAKGSTVTITGTNLGNFTPAPQAKFGTTTATVSSATATAITVTVPAGLTAGNSTITLSNFDGTGVVTVGTFNVTASGGGGSPVAGQMGGAIQTAPLALTGTASAYVGSGALSSLDGTGTAATMALPMGITTDGSNLYFTDFFSKVRKIVISTGVVTTIAGTGAAGAADGTGTAASFFAPKGITTDGTNLYVADSQYGKIRKIVISTGVVTTLAGGGAGTATDGTGTAASFNVPSGITTDGANLYVADTNNHKIRQIVIASGVVTTLAGSGAMGSVNATGTAASFNQPWGLTTDGTSLYVSDSYNNLIRKVVIATGVVTTLAGATANTGPLAGADGTGTAARFSLPYGLSSDGTNLYVADSGYNAIRRIVISTGVVTTLTSGLNVPFGVTTDGTSLFETDYNSNTIKKVQ